LAAQTLSAVAMVGVGEDPLVGTALIAAFGQMLGLAHHAPLAAPTLVGAVAGIGSNRPAIESGRHFSPGQGLEIKRLLATLCFHRAASLLVSKVVIH
jgi:hypothetical protein